MLEWALDGVLGVGVLWLAWMALSGEDLFRSVVLYIVFGLLLALAWVRLEAPDVALAEAAIGAGLTGALLLDAASQLTGRVEHAAESGQPSERLHDERPERSRVGRDARGRKSVIVGALATAGVFLLGGVAAVGVFGVSEAGGGLTAVAGRELGRSGVTHGVTAVLLNFRAFDTLLEVGVLLAAVLAMLVVRRASDLGDVSPPALPAPVLTIVVRVLIPLMVLMAGFLLWLGTHAPGGAFQAGALLGSAAVFLFLAGYRSIGGLRATSLATVLVSGFAVFLAVGLVTLIVGLRLLELPTKWAGPAIVLIEGMLAISIGGTLAALFLGARPLARADLAAQAGTVESGRE